MNNLQAWQKFLVWVCAATILGWLLILAFVHFVAIPTFNNVENHPVRPAPTL